MKLCSNAIIIFFFLALRSGTRAVGFIPMPFRWSIPVPTLRRAKATGRCSNVQGVSAKFNMAQSRVTQFVPTLRRGNAIPRRKERRRSANQRHTLHLRLGCQSVRQMSFHAPCVGTSRNNWYCVPGFRPDSVSFRIR